MSKECQICNANLPDNSENCPECGWEQVVIPDAASEQLKRIVNEKKLVYKQNYDRFKKAIDSLPQLQEKNRQLEKKLEKTANSHPSFTGRQLCALTEDGEIILLKPGELTFGRLGPTSETHYVFSSDKNMDSKHFALQIIPDGPLFSCKIKNIGRKDTFVNRVKRIGSAWDNINVNDEITAGNTKLKLVLSK